jgi:hypothetical protein
MVTIVFKIIKEQTGMLKYTEQGCCKKTIPQNILKMFINYFTKSSMQYLCTPKSEIY